jgi:hypothetical protein
MGFPGGLGAGMAKTAQDVLDYSLFEDADPGFIWLQGERARGYNQRNFNEAMSRAAEEGIDPNKFYEQKTYKEAQKEAMGLVQQTSHLSDEEFNGLLERLKGELDQTPQLPEQTQPRMPSREQLGIAALGSAFFPEHAFEIGAQPYQYSQGQAQEQDERNLAQFGVTEKARQGRIAGMRDIYGEESQARRFDTQQVGMMTRQLIEDSYKRERDKIEDAFKQKALDADAAERALRRLEAQKSLGNNERHACARRLTDSPACASVTFVIPQVAHPPTESRR